MWVVGGRIGEVRGKLDVQAVRAPRLTSHNEVPPGVRVLENVRHAFGVGTELSADPGPAEFRCAAPPSAVKNPHHLSLRSRKGEDATS